MTKTPTSVLDIHIGSRVKMARMMRGLSREVLADRLGVELDAMTAYERGERRFGPTLLQDAAGIIGVTVSHFFGDFDSGMDIIRPFATEPDDGSLPDVAEVQAMIDAFVQVRSSSLRDGLLRQAQAAVEVTCGTAAND